MMKVVMRNKNIKLRLKTNYKIRSIKTNRNKILKGQELMN